MWFQQVMKRMRTVMGAVKNVKTNPRIPLMEKRVVHLQMVVESLEALKELLLLQLIPHQHQGKIVQISLQPVAQHRIQLIRLPLQVNRNKGFSFSYIYRFLLIDPGDTTNTEQQPSTSVVKVEEVKVEEPVVEVHPRKRKLRPRDPEPPAETVVVAATNVVQQPQENVTPPLPLTNCYEMYFSIRKQIERRHRNLLPVQPKPPQGFKDYLMNRCTYVIAGNAASRLSVPVVSPPPSLPPPMRDLFAEQEKERYRLRMQVC